MKPVIYLCSYASCRVISYDTEGYRQPECPGCERRGFKKTD